MKYPITLTFKILALASQIYVRDANGNLIGYVKQKLLKLKEDVDVFADENQTQLLYNIKADRVIDFSAKYNFTDAQGRFLGSIKRQGRRSIWKSHYIVSDASDQILFEIHEENAWIKVIDAVAGEVPVVGMFTGYFFNPSYVVSKNGGASVARLQKKPAFLEGKFELSSQGIMAESEETVVYLGVLMMTLLERARG